MKDGLIKVFAPHMLGSSREKRNAELTAFQPNLDRSYVGDLTKPPANLATPEQELWCRIVDSYELPDDDPAVWTILRGLCEAAGTARLANDALKQHGVLIRAGSGGMKANPAVNIAHQAREQVLRHARALGLNLEPLNDRPGRPPAPGPALL